MYVCYVVPFFTNKAVCMLYVCVSSDMFVFVYDVYNIWFLFANSSKCLFVWLSLSVLCIFGIVVNALIAESVFCLYL